MTIPLHEGNVANSRSAVTSETACAPVSERIFKNLCFQSKLDSSPALLRLQFVQLAAQINFRGRVMNVIFIDVARYVIGLLAISLFIAIHVKSSLFVRKERHRDG
jgi:hypothetical protein